MNLVTASWGFSGAEAAISGRNTTGNLKEFLEAMETSLQVRNILAPVLGELLSWILHPVTLSGSHGADSRKTPQRDEFLGKEDP